MIEIIPKRQKREPIPEPAFLFFKDRFQYNSPGQKMFDRYKINFKHNLIPIVKLYIKLIEMARLEVQPKKYKGWFNWLVALIALALTLFYFLSDKIIY